jgi:hypothetical protein
VVSRPRAHDKIRDGAWVAEITGLVDLSAWPDRSRLIVRKERPHPGAQLSLFDLVEGMRHTVNIPREPDTGLRS